MQKRFLFTPALVIVFILFFTVFGERGLLRINHLHRDRDEMQKRVQELKDENDKLKREIAALQTDRRYLESIARRDFGLVRSNEVIYQFQSADKAAPPQGEKKPEADHSGGVKAGAKAAAPAQKR
jgi:cell division protein FtsB